MKQTIDFPCVECGARPGQLCPHMVTATGDRDYTKVFHFSRVIDAIYTDMNAPVNNEHLHTGQ